MTRANFSFVLRCCKSGIQLHLKFPTSSWTWAEKGKYGWLYAAEALRLTRTPLESQHVIALTSVSKCPSSWQVWNQDESELIKLSPALKNQLSKWHWCHSDLWVRAIVDSLAFRVIFSSFPYECILMLLSILIFSFVFLGSHLADIWHTCIHAALMDPHICVWAIVCIWDWYSLWVWKRILCRSGFKWYIYTYMYLQPQLQNIWDSM